jgi:Cysteine-rich secretory protein family/SdrD B-like domain
MAQPTAQEQQMLELVNRMRQAPAAELNILLNSGDPNIDNALTFFNVDRNTLNQQWSQLSPTAPVAWSSELSNAALSHNQQMIAANLQSHQVPGELPFAQRNVNAGYQDFSYLGENIAAYSTSVFQGEASLAIDWGNGPDGIQSPTGHRNNIMSGNFREIGIGVTANSGNSLGPQVITQELGNRFSLENKAWLLGVAFNDNNNNQFYDVGEGLSGVTVEVDNLSQPTATPLITTTLDAGGYQTLLDPGQYQVKFLQNNTLLKSENISVDSQNPTNIKQDLRLPLPPAAVSAPVAPSAPLGITPLPPVNLTDNPIPAKPEVPPSSPTINPPTPNNIPPVTPIGIVPEGLQPSTPPANTGNPPTPPTTLIAPSVPQSITPEPIQAIDPTPVPVAPDILSPPILDPRVVSMELEQPLIPNMVDLPMVDNVGSDGQPSDMLTGQNDQEVAMFLMDDLIAEGMPETFAKGDFQEIRSFDMSDLNDLFSSGTGETLASLVPQLLMTVEDSSDGSWLRTNSCGQGSR